MMTDGESIDRLNGFIAEFREMVAAAVVDTASPCADYHRRGLERIAATVGQVDYAFFSNLANINAALRGGLLELIEVRLLAVGAGPTMDFVDAAAFLAGFRPMIERGAGAAA